ncbi:MAG: glycosyltransferase family 2 protein [Pseudomonadota bacterium]
MKVQSASLASQVEIAVVLPCYKVTSHVVDVIKAIGPEVSRIYAVDDCCPDHSGDHIEEHVDDPRVRVLRHEVNKGVGGAVITGYRAAIEEGIDIIAKVDGDGQMDPALLPRFLAPIIAQEADYAKGNRFYSATAVSTMPGTRLVGNAILSFFTKLSSGYWSNFDPTNGYTAVHTDALRAIDLRALSERYFFETDMLIRLGELRAVVVDVPMDAVYGDEVSGLKISRILLEFLGKHLKATVRRITYQYFLRDFSFASLNLLMGLPLLVFGIIFGMIEWFISNSTGVVATTGTVMIAVLPIITGIQMLLLFLSSDIASEPTRPFQGTTRAMLSERSRT